MKAIMLSVKPKWLAKILNGEKNVEVRKGTALYKAITKLIEQYGEATIYFYCTKGEQLVKYMYFRDDDIYALGKGNKIPFDNMINAIQLNGKVVACFKCKKVEEIVKRLRNGYFITYTSWETPTLNFFCLCEKSCLKPYELGLYLENEEGNATAIHISNLLIFDKPKELGEFYKIDYKRCHCNIDDVFGLQECNNICKLCKRLTKAPQSYMFVEVNSWRS